MLSTKTNRPSFTMSTTADLVGLRWASSVMVPVTPLKFFVVARAFRMATAGEVETPDGTVIPSTVDSLCLHGDTPGTVELTRRVREALLAAGVRLAPFVPLI